MLNIIHTTNSFRIQYNNYIFLSHSLEHPCITLAIGNGQYKEKYGAYRIKDKVQQKTPLSLFKITERSNTKIILTLEDHDLQCTLTITEQNNIILIEPEVNKPEFNRFYLSLPAKVSEGIFGCGEQFSELNLRGLKVPLWSQEQGLGRAVNNDRESPYVRARKIEKRGIQNLKNRIVTGLINIFGGGVGGSWHTTYHPQPTFISSEDYFYHLESSAYAIFDFKNPDYHKLEVWQIPSKIYFGKYNSIPETLTSLSQILGRQPRLPDWVYDGMWLALQGTNGVQGVKDRLAKAQEKGIKVSAVWSQDWQGIYVTSFGTQLFWDWKWNGTGREIRFENFPDFVKELNQQGIRYLGYINSFLNTGGDLYKEAQKKGYLVKTQEGEPYHVQVTTFPVGIVDLTNPEAFEWIKSVMKNNMIGEAGLSGWMSDFGEYLPPDAKLFSGESGETFHNRFPAEWARANYEALEEAGKLGEVVFFTRSGYTHTSKYSTLIWAGDQLPSWSLDDGLASVIPAGLSLGICGIGYHHSDIGGYTTFKPVWVRSKEVFMRWAEQAAFTMVMRTHESNRPEFNPQFDYDDETMEHLARMTQIHVHLKPYLQALSTEYQETGLPPMRALVIHYENDPSALKIKYEYLLGKDLLVAPVYKKGKRIWKLYLPDDKWIHIWSKKTYSKGWVEIPAILGQPPVFYKEGSNWAELFEKLGNF